MVLTVSSILTDTTAALTPSPVQPSGTVYRIVNVHEEELLIHAVQRRLMPHEMQYPPLVVHQQ